VRLIKRFMYLDAEPVEIALVKIDTDSEHRQRIDAAIEAARKSMGARHLTHPDNRVQKLKAA
jgi:hypothetical protein